MKVFGVLQVLVLLVFVTYTQSKTIKDEEKSKNVTTYLDPKNSPEDNTDAIRKKKSATTTLCVEIRPSGPYQRPFQICEPAEGKPYAPALAPAQGYYPAPSYEEVKPAASGTVKTGAVYEAPAKAYAAPAKPSAAPAYGSSKPYAAHSSSSYNSVSYRSEDGTEEMVDGEEEHSDDENIEHWARSSGQEYGIPVTYLQPAKHKPKKGHNGLVITCQPSLAGYAATVPSHSGPANLYGGSYGGGPGYGSYRSAGVRSYGRPSPPRVHPGYAASYAPASVYKGPAPIYKVPAPLPSYSYKSPVVYSSPSYKPVSSYGPAPSYSAPAPAPSYSAPVYSVPAPQPQYKPSYIPAPAPQSNYKISYSPAPQPQPQYKPAPQPQYKPVYAPAPEPSYEVPAPAPEPSYGAPANSYVPAPSPAYAPASGPSYVPASSPSYVPAPAPSYAAGPAPSYVPAPAPAYSSAPVPSYSVSGPYVPAPKPQLHISHAPVYNPPPTYREAEALRHHTETNTHMSTTQEEKEHHTMKTMSTIAEARDAENMIGDSSDVPPHTKVQMGSPSWNKIEEDDKSAKIDELRGAEHMSHKEESIRASI